PNPVNRCARKPIRSFVACRDEERKPGWLARFLCVESRCGYIKTRRGLATMRPAVSLGFLHCLAPGKIRRGARKQYFSRSKTRAKPSPKCSVSPRICKLLKLNATTVGPALVGILEPS